VSVNARKSRVVVLVIDASPSKDGRVDLHGRCFNCFASSHIACHCMSSPYEMLLLPRAQHRSFECPRQLATLKHSRNFMERPGGLASSSLVGRVCLGNQFRGHTRSSTPPPPPPLYYNLEESIGARLKRAELASLHHWAKMRAQRHLWHPL
jgi:hypothetical protein